VRSYDPTDKYDIKEAARLGAEQWMLDLLDMNPEYSSWGPYEDYMAGSKAQWSSPVVKDEWEPFGLDDLNEVVNFYFEISRDSRECATCAGAGYHPDAQWVTESFYQHSSPFCAGDRALSRAFSRAFGDGSFSEVHGPNTFPSEATLAKYGPEFRAFCEQMRDGDGYWNDKATQDEVDALMSKGRLNIESGRKWDSETREWIGGRRLSATEVNAMQHGRGFGFGHDAINRSIMIRARLDRFGIPATCPECDGHGSVFTVDKPTLGVVLWVLHPRKGCSRGVHLRSIQREQLPEVFVYLRAAALRNAARFAKIPEAP